MTVGVYGEIAKDGSRIVLAVSGDDWELKRTASLLRHMTPLLASTEPPSAVNFFPLTWSAVCQLGHTFTGSASTGQWLPGPQLRKWITDEFCRRHSTQAPLNVSIPDGLKARPYQLDAARMIGLTRKFLLFDEPGCGKTVSTILGLKNVHNLVHIFPLMIVVPSWDVADVWARHIAQWAPEWPQPVMYGGPDRRLAKDGISISTYATVRNDWAPGNGGTLPKPATVVLDEAHYVKNEQAKRTHAVTRIAAKAGTIVALTGTPVTRDTGDIFPVLAAMDPESYPSRDRFKKRYLQVSDNGYGEVIEGLAPLSEPEFRIVLAGQYRRVSKADVLDQLPPKIYSVRRVEIPPEWRKAYDGMAADMLAELPEGDELPVMSVLAQLTRLQQLASSACDVEVSTEVNDYGEEQKSYTVTLKAPSWKADALLGILAERPGQPVAVFANSSQLIDITRTACEKAGYRCGWITGNQGKGVRRLSIKKFQAGELDVILCTAGAGGLGITLTAAGTAVFLQRSWQLDLAVQPEDRLHRIGQQHKAVEIIDVIAKDTVDDRTRELVHIKGGRLAELVKDPRIVRELLGGLR